MESEKDGATPTLIPLVALRPIARPIPVELDCELVMLEESEWLFALAVLCVSA